MSKRKKRNFDTENFRLFYQIQYDRIEQLETKRENFCNYIITISSAIIVLTFTKEVNLTLLNKTFLLVFLILTNLLVLIFIDKTRLWVKMHQKRIKEGCKRHAKELNDINNYIGKAESDNDYFRRSRIYSYVHSLIILLSFLLLISENHFVC